MISKNLSKGLNSIIPGKLSQAVETGASALVRRLISVEPWPENGLVLPRLQAHRGSCNDGAQENTLEAFRSAKKRGALMVECDVQLSKDRIPIIFHDWNLTRLGSTHQKVGDLTAQELREKVQAPTLRELLMDSQSPRLVNIELKSRSKLDDPLERKVSQVVQELKAESRVLFSSFNPFSLYRIGLFLPDIPRALLVSSTDDKENNFLLRKMWLAPFVRFHCLNLDQEIVDDASMKIWKEKRIPIGVWTVNGQQKIQKYLRMGAITVITDTVGLKD